MEVLGQTMLQLSVMSLGGLKPEAQLGLLLGGEGGGGAKYYFLTV